ncbi:MAG: hypothetical protein IJX62_09165 [Clostridia bacterium]|nr:hypothetical protein [Clostridia bacterium]
MKIISIPVHKKYFSKKFNFLQGKKPWIWIFMQKERQIRTGMGSGWRSFDRNLLFLPVKMPKLPGFS